jgi:hypothetical protein
VVLNWSTLSEQNSDYFSIERSQNGSEWHAIGEVQAVGNSSVEQLYQLIDDASRSNTMIYYRVLQFDFQGESAIFGPFSVECTTDLDEIVVFPNPFHEEFTVIFNSANFEGKNELFLLDVHGRIVYNKELEVKNGLVYTLDARSFQTGVYLIGLTNSEGKVTHRKIVKL